MVSLDKVVIGVAILIATAAVSLAITGQVLKWLRRRAILDLPNERSSHTVPTPRGGGWGVMMTVLPAWIGITGYTGSLAVMWPVIAGAGVLIAISWMDDRRGLGPAPRFLTQIVVVGLGLIALPEGPVFQGLLPLWADRIVAAVGWLWFVNLFNFMDGIDGIAGSEVVAICIGVAVLSLTLAAPIEDGALGLAAAGAALGFLVWNWHPAKVFMGDVGSVPLGYLLGWLLLALAARGQAAAAVLLPAYFLADATLTLLRRAAEGKKVWQAHREHFYQKATLAGLRHDQVVARIIGVNIVLVVLAVMAAAWGWIAVGLGAVAVALVLGELARDRRRPSVQLDGKAS